MSEENKIKRIPFNASEVVALVLLIPSKKQRIKELDQLWNDAESAHFEYGADIYWNALMVETNGRFWDEYL